MGETLADYLLQELKLSIPHQIWCHGGHVLILAPHTAWITYHLKACYEQINTFLLKQFRGKPAFVLSWMPVTGEDLQYRFPSACRRLRLSLERGKLRKSSNILREQDAPQFVSEPPEKSPGSHAASPDYYHEQLQHTWKHIGTQLSKLGKDGHGNLAKFYQPDTYDSENSFLVEFIIGATHISWVLNSSNIGHADTLYWLNDPLKEFQKTGTVKQGMKYLPIAGEVFSKQEIRDSFGVMCMDVDHLDGIFDFGLPLQSLSRATAMSSEIYLFFAGYVQHLCKSQFPQLCLFYSDSDDLLIAGTWEQVVDCASQIRTDFNAAACDNPAFSISASLVICNSVTSIPQAAKQAQEELVHRAKLNINQEPDLEGNVTAWDSFTLFNHRLPWDLFSTFKKTGDILVEAIMNRILDRAYLHKLHQLHHNWQQHRQITTARLYYISVRNIPDTQLRTVVLTQLASHTHLSHPSYIPLLIGYVKLRLEQAEA